MHAQSHQIKATLTQDGTLTLDHLPFHAGEAVEVLVLPASAPLKDDHTGKRFALRGASSHEGSPFTPVGEED